MGYDIVQSSAAVLFIQWWVFIGMLAGCYVLGVLGGRLISWTIHTMFL